MTLDPGAKGLTETYFARRRKIYPRAAHGYFRRLKWGVIAVTLGLYYLVPFIPWNRGPGLPDQAVLVDLAHSRAYFFGLEIWPQEVYYIAGLLVFGAIALFFVTGLFGRIWCGYFCPQTVWTDLFIKVEDLVQGDRGARKRLDESPWGIEKIWKKGLTHFLWLVISFLTGGAFVFYFNDATDLLAGLAAGHVSPIALMFVAGLTLSTYVMAGLAREQVCVYMCPYSRFQSAMFDRDTLIIAYDAARGEPRGKPVKGTSVEQPPKGDCIDCSACVQVCPTGIDIREGLQIECIACGLCVDACDEVMDRIGRPRGLVRYDSERNMAAGAPRWRLGRALLRPAPLSYAAVLILVAIIGVYNLSTRRTIEFQVLHDRNPLFVRLSDGQIRNGYDLNLLNKKHADRKFRIQVSGVPGAELVFRLPVPPIDGVVSVPGGTMGRFHVFLKADEQAEIRSPIVFLVEDVSSAPGESMTHESFFISRGGGR